MRIFTFFLMMLFAFFSPLRQSSAQNQHVDNSPLLMPDFFNNLHKTIPIVIINDSLYVMTADPDQGSGTCFMKRYNYWEPRFYWLPVEWGMEFFVSPDGGFYIYNPFEDSLMIIWGEFFYEYRFCPGRPVFDHDGRIHIIEEVSENEYVYFISDDTLNSLIYIDTLQNFPQFQKLILNPDYSMIAAVFFDFQSDRIYKYMSLNGVIDFSNPIIFQSEDLIWGLYDMVLDYQNEIIAVVRHDENLWGYYDHYVWAEDFGFAFLNMGNDEAMVPVYYEISFGPNDDEIIIIGNDFYYYGDSWFHYSSDGGNTWHRSLFEMYYAAHGSSLRTFNDTLHFVYSTGLYGNVETYYYPIPVDSIANNLTSVNEESLSPQIISLLRAYPNPFNAKTSIEFALAAPGDVELTIYDITGARVEELVNANMIAGKHTVEWDASGYGSGTYFAKIATEMGSKTLKMVMIK
ncbi:MAG: T9SS type A sorting domain-containing protein [Candidatus Zixiibacteriota bacterium]|nr:MAG: T9SS type A sorting domain-containing protein [candidate division Zixibacteria bacterium]